MEKFQFEKEYGIHVYETGPDSKVTLFSMFNYMQDIASDHAVKLGFGRDDLLKESRFWVLSRMFVTFTRWPLWGDSIKITTWPNGTDKLFALRNYEVRFANGTHIASGSSSWLILDYSTHKIQRPDAILSKYYPDLHPSESPIRYASKLETADQAGKVTSPFSVKMSDLDVNYHTNNARYINWVYDTYGQEFLTKHMPVSAEINYLAESVLDDEIIIRTSEDQYNNMYQNHTVVRINDDKELCRIRIEWKENAFN